MHVSILYKKNFRCGGTFPRNGYKGGSMKEKNLPTHFKSVRERFPDVVHASAKLGEAARASGPVKEKEGHLIQLAAAVAIRSHGSVHSHARRARQAGASVEEVYHTVLLLTSTLGFPVVAAGLSWLDEMELENY